MARFNLHDQGKAMSVVMLCVILCWQLQPAGALPAPPSAGSGPQAAEQVPVPKPDLPFTASVMPPSVPSAVISYATMPSVGTATLHLDVPNRAKIFIETRTAGVMRASVGTWNRYRHFRVPVRVDTEEPVKVTVQLRKDHCECRYVSEQCNCDHEVVSCCKTVFLRAGDDEYLDFRRRGEAGETLPHLSFVVEPRGEGCDRSATTEAASSPQPSRSPPEPTAASESPSDEVPPVPSAPDAAPPVVPPPSDTAPPPQIDPPANE